MEDLNKLLFSLIMIVIPVEVKSQVIMGDTSGMDYHNVSYLLYPPTLTWQSGSSGSGEYFDLTKDSIWDVFLEAYQSNISGENYGRNFLGIFNPDFEFVLNPMSQSVRMFNASASLHSTMYWYRFNGVNLDSINLAEFTSNPNIVSSGMWYNTNGIGDGFIGFRIASHIDTLYGWFHLVSTMSCFSGPFATLFIKDWAIQKFPSALDRANEPINVQIFPNPFANQLNIFVENRQNFKINIYDAASKLILQKEFTQFASLNTSAFSQGLYLYEIYGPDDLYKAGKIIKE